MLPGHHLRDNAAHVERPQGQTTDPVAPGANFIARREEKQILLPQGGIRMTCPAAADSG
jgi:hypothetical protein